MKTSEKRTPASVLIVNEDPAILVLLASMLERNGYRALLARSRAEAVEITSRHYVPVDMVLCDVLVGGEGAQSIMAAVRENRPAVRELFLSTGVESGAIRIGVVRPS